MHINSIGASSAPDLRARTRRSWLYPACALIMFCVSVVTVAGSAKAQNRVEAPPDTIVALPEIVISDSLRVFGTGTVRYRRFHAAPRVADQGASVAEFLARRSMMDVRRAGFTGEAAGSIRGAGAAGTPILMDGFRLADPQTGVVDLSMIPLSQIESVELVHGPAGKAGALGGAVVLRSQPPSRAEEAFSAATGAFGRRMMSTSAGGRIAGFDASVSGMTTRTDGDFPFRNTAAFPAREETRRGAGRQVTSVSLAAGRNVAGSTLRVLSWLSDSIRGVPGPANSSGSGAVLDDRLFRAQMDADGRFGSVRLTAGVSTTRTARTYTNPDDGQRSFNGATTTARAEATRVLHAKWVLRTGLRLRRATADIDRAPRRGVAALHTEVVRSTERLALRSSLELSAARSRMADAGEAVVRSSTTVESTDRNVEFLPSAGMRVELRPGLAVRISGARSFRRPTLNELYWQPGGNPALRPERGWMLDAGVSAERRLLGVAWVADVGIYRGRMKNRIAWQPALAGSAVRVWRAVNVGRVGLRGAEGGLEGRFEALAGSWTLSLHGARTSAIDRTNPDAPSWASQLRYVPTASAVGSVAFEYGTWSLRLDSRWSGRRYTTTDESLYLAPWRVSTLSATRSVYTTTVAIRLGLTIKNLENADYEVMRLYPMPPRHALFTLSVTSASSGK